MHIITIMKIKINNYEIIVELSTISFNNLPYLIIVNYLILYYKNKIANCANIEQPQKGPF